MLSVKKLFIGFIEEAMTDIKLIAVDLDGTLIRDSHHIPERNIKALQKVLAQGVIVAIATGRMHSSACQFVKRLGLGADTPIISYNGAMIRLPEASDPLWHRPLPADLAAEIVEHAVQEQLPLNYFLEDTLYVPRVDYWARLYLRRTGNIPLPAGDLRRFRGKSPTKLIICARPEEAEELLMMEQKRFAPRAYVTRSMPEYIEFLHPEANKGVALQWLATYYGVSRENVMALGDMLNDLPMIEWAGIGVAMPHAAEAVRAAADFVPGDPEAGVAEALEKILA